MQDYQKIKIDAPKPWRTQYLKFKYTIHPPHLPYPNLYVSGTSHHVTGVNRSSTPSLTSSPFPLPYLLFAFFLVLLNIYNCLTFACFSLVIGFSCWQSSFQRTEAMSVPFFLHPQCQHSVPLN